MSAGKAPRGPTPLRYDPAYNVRHEGADQLTIRISQDVLDGAKRYAREHGTSLTRLVTLVSGAVGYSRRCARGGTYHPWPWPARYPLPPAALNTWSISSTNMAESAARTLRVLLDVDVILDVLARREPFFGGFGRPAGGL